MTTIKPGTVIRDEKNNRYLVCKVDTKKNAIECLDNKFDPIGIGIDFLSRYEFVENINMEFMASFINDNNNNELYTYIKPDKKVSDTMPANETFSEWLNNNWDKDNIFPPPLSDRKAMKFLTDYLLGKDWYSVNPISQEQINTEIVHDILIKYSKEYRKETK